MILSVNTDYAWRLCFRGSEIESIEITIRPDEKRSPEDQQRLGAKRWASVHDLQQLPQLIKAAEKKLGLGASNSFARDVLSVRVTGPKVPSLTLVDLPCIIHFSSENRDNVAFVDGIIDNWMSQKGSVILAVVEANQGREKHPIFEKINQFDPSGERSFGIITKPDLVEDQPEVRKFWIDCARNAYDRKDRLALKEWHVLLNRNATEVKDNTTQEQRDTKEREFFENPQSDWYVVDPESCGIQKLRERLSRMLFEHSKKQLPSLRKEILAKLGGYEEKLDAITARLLEPEALWENYQKECKELVRLVAYAVQGTYQNSPVFDQYQDETSFYLRTDIENAYTIFHNSLIENGRGISFLPANGSLATENELWTEEVKKLLDCTIGNQLPGKTDPERINILFRKHSAPWREIALGLIERAHSHCQLFVNNLTTSHLQNSLPALPAGVPSRMLEAARKALREYRKQAVAELDLLEKDRKRACKTRNKAWKEKSDQAKAERQMRVVNYALDNDETAAAGQDGRRSMQITPTFVAQKTAPVSKTAEAEQLAKEMLIYYDVSLDSVLNISPSFFIVFFLSFVFIAVSLPRFAVRWKGCLKHDF